MVKKGPKMTKKVDFGSILDDFWMGFLEDFSYKGPVCGNFACQKRSEKVVLGGLGVGGLDFLLLGRADDVASPILYFLHVKSTFLYAFYISQYALKVQVSFCEMLSICVLVFLGCFLRICPVKVVFWGVFGTF